VIRPLLVALCALSLAACAMTHTRPYTVAEAREIVNEPVPQCVRDAVVAQGGKDQTGAVDLGKRCAQEYARYTDARAHLKPMLEEYDAEQTVEQPPTTPKREGRPPFWPTVWQSMKDHPLIWSACLVAVGTVLHEAMKREHYTPSSNPAHCPPVPCDPLPPEFPGCVVPGKCQ
jgi:hypothetical protein